MALSANRDCPHYSDQELRTLSVKGTTHVYKGAILGVTAAGYARGLVAGDRFAGIAYEEANNTGADGAMDLRVYTLGDFDHALTGAAITDVGRPVFASADNTLTFAGHGNAYVGVVQDFVSTNNIIVRLSPHKLPIKTITHMVENLGAGVDIAARAIHAFVNEAWITAVRVINQATSAVGIDAGNTCVVAVALTAGGAVATETFDATPAFPAANAVYNIATITNPHAAAADVLTLAVTNGATADPGPAILEVDYV